MKSSKAILVGLLAVIILCGCETTQNIIDGGSSGAEPPPESIPSNDGTTPATDPEAIAVDLTPKNPYLANPKNVSTRARQLYAIALELHEKEKWAEAELAWQELTVTEPGLSGPFLNLGKVYEATDRLDAAEEAYRGAIAANKLNLSAYNQLAILKRSRGEFSEAETLYLQALDVWPEHPVSHRNLAILYDLYMGRLVDALRHYERYEALAENPERALAGWLADLRRRIDRLAQEN